MTRCEQCGEEHPDEGMELTFRRPDEIAALASDRRAREVRESDDLCAIRGARWFVRAVLPLIVAGREQPYRIGVWVEVDEAVYRRVDELWDDPDQAGEPPFEARLANAIPTLPATLGLPAILRLTGPTTRPEVLVAAADHPLFHEQARGITAHRAFEYTAATGGAGTRH